MNQRENSGLDCDGPARAKPDIEIVKCITAKHNLFHEADAKHHQRPAAQCQQRVLPTANLGRDGKAPDLDVARKPEDAEGEGDREESADDATCELSEKSGGTQAQRNEYAAVEEAATEPQPQKNRRVDQQVGN